MVFGMEDGREVIREQIATINFIPGEPSTLLEHTRAMHAEVKYFLETDFASNLHFDELDMDDLLQLCSNPDAEVKHHE